MNVVFRVLVGAFVCVAPSVLFLGLWHGLERLQNGEFVARVADHHGVAVEDLVPGARPHRTNELDATERRALRRFATEDAPREAHARDAFAPDERDSP